MQRPLFIDVAEEEEEESVKKGQDSSADRHRLTTPETLKQTFCIVPAKLRLVTLLAFIVWKCRLARRAKQAPRKMLVRQST